MKPTSLPFFFIFAARVFGSEYFEESEENCSHVTPRIYTEYIDRVISDTDALPVQNDQLAENIQEKEYKSFSSDSEEESVIDELDMPPVEIKPSRLAVFLAKSLVGLVDPDVIKTMEEKLLREPFEVYLSARRPSDAPNYLLNDLYLGLNQLYLIAEESEHDAKLLGAKDNFEDILHVQVHHIDDEYDCGGIDLRRYDLNAKLFEAAVSTLNFERLNELFTKRKHFLLKPKTKGDIMKYAILEGRFSDKVETCCQIFKKLLENGFYPENYEFDRVYMSKDSEYPFYGIIQNQLLCQSFLDYDKDIFKKQKKVNYITELIKRDKYELAFKALDLGFDPKVKENGGDALDEILKPITYELNAEEKRQRAKLTEILEQRVPRI